MLGETEVVGLVVPWFMRVRVRGVRLGESALESNLERDRQSTDSFWRGLHSWCRVCLYNVPFVKNPVATAAILSRFVGHMHAPRPTGFLILLGLLVVPWVGNAQRSGPDLRAVSNDRPVNIPETIEPSWDTRPDDRTLYFSIPAPRGQITDRNGLPLAQSRLGYHLNLKFPPGEDLTDTQVAAFVKTQLVLAQSFMRRPLEVNTSDVLDHYHNRRMLPMDIATYLTPEEVETVRRKITPDGALGLRTDLPALLSRTARWPRMSSVIAA